MALPSPLLAVPNVTAHPSTASVPVTALLHNGPLLCGFNVAIKGLKCDSVLFSSLTDTHGQLPAVLPANGHLPGVPPLAGDRPKFSVDC